MLDVTSIIAQMKKKNYREYLFLKNKINLN